MSKEARKSYASTLLLLALGALTLCAGKTCLPVLIPVALLVYYGYYGADPALRGGRN